MSSEEGKKKELSHSRADLFVCIQTQNPLSRCFLDRRVLLRGIALPFFNEYSRSKRFCDFDGPIGRAGIDDDDLAFSIDNQRLHAGERARDINFLVMSDDDDREDHTEFLPRENTRELAPRKRETPGCEARRFAA